MNKVNEYIVDDAYNKAKFLVDEEAEHYKKVYIKNPLLLEKLCKQKRNIMKNRSQNAKEIYVQLELHKYHTFHVHEIWNNRIGEFIGRINIELGNMDENRKKGILDIYILRYMNSCNEYFSEMLKRCLVLITLETLDIWAYIFSKSSQKLQITPVEFVRTAPRVYITKTGVPFVDFTKEETIQGELQLQKMGIKKEFVCIFSRDSAYLDKLFPGVDDSYHNYRDSDIMKFKPVISYLGGGGRSVLSVRMGQVSEKPLDIDNCIDFSNQYYNEFMDLYLFSRCKFFIGDCAGITFIPSFFARPVALTNVAWAFGMGYGGWPLNSDDLFIPKNYYDIKKGRLLTFVERFEFETQKFHGKMQELDYYGLKIVDNTEEEILDLAKEMFHKLDGTWKKKPGDKERQTLYRQQLKSYYETNNLNYADTIQTTIGETFLRKYKELLKVY